MFPLILCFSKKLDSNNPTIMSLDSAIKNDTAFQRIDNAVVLVVTLNGFSLLVRENRFAPALGRNSMGYGV